MNDEIEQDQDVDTSEPEKQQDLPDQVEADSAAASDDEDGFSHDDNTGEVIGRRNPDLPTENLTVPPTN